MSGEDPDGRVPTGEDVADAALSFLGTPYHLRGRVPGVALDCLGVVVCAFRLAGISIEETPNYRREARMGYEELRLFLRDFVRIRPDADGFTRFRYGDVAMWKLGAQGHLGVYVDRGDEDGIVNADDAIELGEVAIAPLGRVDRVYRHRSLA